MVNRVYRGGDGFPSKPKAVWDAMPATTGMGEVVLDDEDGRMRVGDGVNPWARIPYCLNPTTDPTTTYAGLDATGRTPARQNARGVRVGCHFPGYASGGGSSTTTSTLATLESDLGVTFDHVLIFQALNPGDSYTGALWSQVQAFLDAGREAVLNLQMQGSLAQLNGGMFDAAIGQFGALVTAYAAANPGWRGKLIVKTLHEGNLTSTYPWCVYAPANLTAAGGSASASAANYVTAFQRVSSLLKAATTSGGVQYARIAWEVGNANNSGDPLQLDAFYPGDAYVDILSLNNYNRYGISSGASYWGTFGSMAKQALDQFARIAPSKPVMIGETSTTPGGILNSVTVTTGGSGYSAGTTATVSGGGSGSGGTVSLTIAGGVITAATITSVGQDYNHTSAPTLTLANTGGGTGATFAVTVQGSKYAKSDWFLDAFRWVRDQADRITYLTWFFENKTVSATDDRQWAPNTAAEKARWREGYGLLNRRTRGTDPALSRQKIGQNLCPDPHTNDVSKWTAAGSNVGTLSRTTSLENLPGDSDVRVQGITSAALGNVTGAIRLSHNGTSGSPTDNRLYFPLPYKAINVNQNVTISFDARAKPTSSSNAGSMYLLPCLETGTSSSATAGSTQRNYTPIPLTSQYQRYSITTNSGDFNASTNGWRIAFCIGSSTMIGELQITNVKVEMGTEPTPLLPPGRQITRTAVADAALSIGITGTNDELIAYTALTAGRTVTLSDATLCLNQVRRIKDESGSAATSNITVATTGGQTIDGAATKTISAAYGSLTVYSNGVNWFTL